MKIQMNANRKLKYLFHKTRIFHENKPSGRGKNICIFYKFHTQKELAGLIWARKHWETMLSQSATEKSNRSMIRQYDVGLENAIEEEIY